VRSIGRWPAGAVSSLALAAVAITVSCATNNQTGTPPTDAAIDVPEIIDGVVDGAQCTTTIELHADEGATHIPCTTTFD